MISTKMILSLILLCASTVGLSASPADGDNIYVFTKQSTAPAIYSLDDLDKITFSENGINFWNTKWPTEYAYDNFRLITFKASDNPNSIESVVVGDVGVIIYYDNLQEMVCVKSEKILSGITVFDVQGRPIAAADYVAREYEVPMSSVPRGIYIVKVKGSSISQKIVK